MGEGHGERAKTKLQYNKHGDDKATRREKLRLVGSYDTTVVSQREANQKLSRCRLVTEPSPKRHYPFGSEDNED